MQRREFVRASAMVALSAAGLRAVALGQTTAPMEAGIVAAGKVRAYRTLFGEARIIVDGARSRGAWWLGRFREAAGFVTPLHRHPHTDEQFFVLSGVLSVFLAGRWHRLGSGDLALVPRGTPHAQGNAGPEPVRFLGAGNPAGFERFFMGQDALLARMPRSDLRFAAGMRRVVASVDMQVLGPPPKL